MEMRFRADQVTTRALLARLRHAGRAANTVMKTSLRRGAKPLQDDIKAAAAGFALTGATMRSVGTKNRKDGVMVGVRNNWTDPKTGKKPEKYAGAVNRKRGDWFGAVWRAHKDLVAARAFKEMEEQLLKKGF